MLHQITRLLLQPSVPRVVYPGWHALKPVPNCFVRYKRNPWSPLPPTKLFLFPVHREPDLQEEAEQRILRARYKTAMKALKYGSIVFSNYIVSKYPCSSVFQSFRRHRSLILVATCNLFWCIFTVIGGLQSAVTGQAWTVHSAQCYGSSPRSQSLRSTDLAYCRLSRCQ